jgi:hypothetical protein
MHTYAHKYVPSRARLVRAHARHARAHSAGTWDRGGRGHSQCLQVGPVDRHRQRREPGVARVPARHQCGRAGRLRTHPYRAPVGPGASHARGLGAADDRQHRRRRVNAGWRRPSARRGSARGSSAATAQPQTHTEAAEARTHRVSKSLHRPSDSGSSFTFVLMMYLRAPQPHNIGQTWARPGESTERQTAGTHAHPHARHRHTSAFGTSDCTLTQMQPTRARPRARPHAHTRASMPLRSTCV